MPKPSTRHVPIYSGENVVGTAYETQDGAWAARMRDGTPLGLHGALIDAQAAILARHHAPVAERPIRNVSGQTVP